MNRTATRTLSRNLLDEVIDVASSTFGTSIDIHEVYSGRGMDGETCFGLIVDNGGERELWAAFGYLAGLAEGRDEDEEVDLMRLAKSARIDGMGRDTIVYFPGWDLD